MAVSPQPPEFPAIFRKAIVKGAQRALETVEGSDSIIQDLQSRSSVLHMLEFALELPEALDPALKIVETLSPQAEQAGFWDEWVPYLEKGIGQSQVIQDEGAEARLRLLLGVLLRQKGDYPEANEHLTKSIEQFQQLGDSSNQAKALNRLAFLCRLQRYYDDAKEYAEKALKLLAVDDTERSYSYLAKGAIAYDHESYEEAVDHFQRSVNIIEQTKDNRLIARHLRNLGPALRALERYDEAIACYQRTIDLFEELSDPVHQAQVRMNLGLVYIQTGQPADALEEFSLAEPTIRNTRDKLYLAMLSLNQGVAHRNLESWLEAVGYIEASIQLWKELHVPLSLANAYDTLGITYLKQGAKQQASIQFQYALDSLVQAVDDPGYHSLMKDVKEHIVVAEELDDLSEETLR